VAETVEVALTVNGAPKRLRLGTDQRLLDVLRDELRLTGAKEGCGKGECGSCTVIVDGRPIVSCLMLGYQADGTVVETIEGLAQGGALHPLQDAFIETGGVQCGICIPGMVMAGKALLDRKERPSPADLREETLVFAEEACALIKSYSAAEGKIVKFIQTNAQTCGIPPEAATQMKANHDRTLRTQLFHAAEKKPLFGRIRNALEMPDSQAIAPANGYDRLLPPIRRLVNESGVQELDGEGFYIRSGIIVVPKGGVVRPGTVV
jgi:carbon-monoxide dehydrogenase small subunit